MQRVPPEEPCSVEKDVHVSVHGDRPRDCRDYQAGPVMAEDPTSASALSQNGRSCTAEGHPIFYKKMAEKEWAAIRYTPAFFVKGQAKEGRR